MSKISLLHEIVKWLPVADIPELVIRLFLPGDNCLHDDDETLDAVFTSPYRKTNDIFRRTYMDPDCTIEHSFDDQPHCVGLDGSMYWYRNGLAGRKGNKSAYAKENDRMWLYRGDLVGVKEDLCQEWYCKRYKLFKRTYFRGEQETEEYLTRQANEWINAHFK